MVDVRGALTMSVCSSALWGLGEEADGMSNASFIALGALSLFSVAQSVAAHAADAVAANNGLESNSSAFSKSAPVNSVPVPFAPPGSSQAAAPQA